MPRNRDTLDAAVQEALMNLPWTIYHSRATVDALITAVTARARSDALTEAREAVRVAFTDEGAKDVVADAIDALRGGV